MLKTATVCFLQYVCIAYAILKTTTLETGHRFALGHNLGAPAPGCDLAVYRRQKGQRDYYWSRYGNSLEWTQRDFNHRVGDFSTFTMGQSKIQSWDRRALTATIPHGTLWI